MCSPSGGNNGIDLIFSNSLSKSSYGTRAKGREDLATDEFKMLPTIMRIIYNPDRYMAAYAGVGSIALSRSVVVTNNGNGLTDVVSGVHRVLLLSI